jgi:exodeoxyribonuclease VII large subunit
VMFRRAGLALAFRPQDGQQVQVSGRMAVYEPRGDMQLVVEAMQSVGAGALYEQFLKLKARLAAQGLFEPGRKRTLPRVPERVGLVTSLAGAVLHDVLTTFARRAPWVQVVLYPSLVQGPQAPAALLQALAQAAQRCEVDVLIVARGGGSLEDLWAFNDEAVVRAVAAMPMPVISGVGHETDVTLTDFAADLRAATPTAAAEAAAPAWEDEARRLAQLEARSRLQARRALETAAQRLDQLALQLGQPAARLAREAGRLESWAWRLREAPRAALQRQTTALARWADALPRPLQRAVGHEAARLAAAGGRLAALDPARVLLRGYTWVRDGQGQPLTSAAQAQAGQGVVVRWHDGEADATVQTVKAVETIDALRPDA